MESEKVKDIRKALECCINNKGCNFCARGNLPYDLDECRLVLTNDILTYINELESENKELKKYRCDWLNSEKMHLQADMEDTEFELSCANEMYKTLSKLYDKAGEKLKKYIEFNNNLVVEKQQLKDRIAELETKNEVLSVELSRYTEHCVEMKNGTLKQFAERLKEQIKAKVDYYNDEVFDYGYNGIREIDVDETLKEFLK